MEKNITPHSFRHTHTSLLIEAGVGIKEIQQRLGHTDINTTMNICSHDRQYGRKGLPTV
ncbi:tyrosine-type recombinase/integrase [Peribacillus sp. TH27]|uniref:tyrosine-type recombinase/integrase n=1 Tax=Peribacillus sp. TH27 TaxID=2798484 RepID=UPI001914B1D4|nr:tyrosine-type recombinase/integrase [Peribacillus sp. TH27]